MDNHRQEGLRWWRANKAKSAERAARYYDKRGGREKQAERYQEKRGEIRQQQNQRAALCRQEKREYDREYRRRNLEKIDTRIAAWRQQNPDKMAVSQRARALVRRDHAFSRATTEMRQWVRVLLADPCAYCGGPSEEIDHIVPIVDGGRTHWTNLVGACGPCNRFKHTKPLLHLLLAS